MLIKIIGVTAVALQLLFGYSFNANASDLASQEHSQITIGEVHTIHSEVLGEDRELQIYIPPNYENNTKVYPVIYTFDGEFIFQTLVSIVEHKSSRDLMPESIVVGIPSNTGKRLDIALPLSTTADGEAHFGGKTDDYLTFLNDEVFPYIEEKYRTASHRTIIGMSPTVGPVYESFWNRPDMFQANIALAADLHMFLPNGENIIDKIIEKAKENNRPNMKLYISRGGLDTIANQEVAESYNQLVELLVATDTGSTDVMVDVLEGQDHYGSAMPALYNAFEFIYPKEQWRPDYIAIREGKDPAGDIKTFYGNLSRQYGYEIVPIEKGFWMGLTLAGTGRFLSRQQDASKTVAWYEMAINYYPNSVWLNSSLVTAYDNNGQLDKAIKIAEQTVALAEQQNHLYISAFKEELEALQAQ